MVEAYYGRIYPKEGGKPIFLTFNKKHTMSLAKLKRIMKWYYKKYGSILDISYKELSRTKDWKERYKYMYGV